MIGSLIHSSQLIGGFFSGKKSKSQGLKFYLQGEKPVVKIRGIFKFG